MKLRRSSGNYRIALLLTAIAPLFENSLAAFSPPEQLVVVTDDSYPPYLFRTDGGQLQGIIQDKWELWSRKTGIPVKVEGMEWAKAQETLKNKAADVIEALAYSDARAKLYEYSLPYAEVDARVFFHRSISGINDVASMRGFTIGAKDGSACANWLEERGLETIRRYPTSDAVVQAARAREVPLFCMDLPVAQYLIYKQNLADEFRETSPLYVARFHWAVLKGRTDLRDFIQRGFQRITAQELQDIETRWLGSSLKLPVDPRYFYYLALVAAGILAAAVLLILWNRTLRLRVSAKTEELSTALGSVQMHADRLRELSAHHDSVREEERAHVAREIHDELGQALTALKMDLSVLGMKFGEDNPEIKTRARELRDTVDRTIQVVRDVATALRPAVLDFGILPAVEGLVEEFQKRSGIRCTLEFLGTETRLAEDKSIMMFRIMQESLTNISRHAGAENVEITVGLDATRFHLEVKDDGCGFDVEAVGRRKTFGLLGIRERVIMLRGELSIRSSPGAGTEVSVSIPYQ
jgi:signal transduction histidine kinase